MPTPLDTIVRLRSLLKSSPSGVLGPAPGADDSSVGRPLLYLCRHGQTELNRANLFRGWSDAMLTEEGKRQAGRAGLYLKDKGVGRIVCADLARTKQTTEIIHNAISGPELDEGRLEIELDQDLRPWNVGEFTGKEKSPALVDQFHHYINNPTETIPMGESLADFRARIEAEIAKYRAVAERMGRPVALVMSTSDIVAAIEVDLNSGRPVDPRCPPDLWQWWESGAVNDVIPPGSVSVLGEDGVEIADLSGIEPVSTRKSRLTGFLPGGGEGAGADACWGCRYYSGPGGGEGICSEPKVQLDPDVSANDQGQKMVQEDDVCDQWTSPAGGTLASAATGTFAKSSSSSSRSHSSSDSSSHLQGGNVAKIGGSFTKFVQLMKVEDRGDGTCTVSGICTSETRDSDGEVCDYKSSKPFYQKWSAGAAKRSGGKSVGNVRAMHGGVCAGLMTAMKFEDPNREVWIQAHIIDADSARKCIAGAYTGFSHGGKYINVWKVDGVTHYTADPCEVSVVDNPANPDAVFDLALSDAPSAGTFQLVDKTGSIELRKFSPKAEAPAADDKEGKDTPDAPDAPNSPDPKPQVGYGLSGEITPPADATDDPKKPPQKPSQKPPLRVHPTPPVPAVGKLQIECATTIDGIGKALEAMEAELQKILAADPTGAGAGVNKFAPEVNDPTSPSSERPATAATQLGKEHAMTQEEMVKAARNAVAHMARMKKAVGDHSDYMSKGFGDLHKILGVEEANSFGADEPTSRGVVPSGATENIQRLDAAEMAKAMVLAMKEAGIIKAQEPAPVAVPVAAPAPTPVVADDASKPLTRAEMTEMLKADREQGLNSLLKALIKADDPDDDEDDPNAPPAAGKKVAKGMGSRSNVAAGGGPQVRVVPVSKTQDAGGNQPTPTVDAPVTAEDVIKARNGDRDAALRVMKGATPQSSVPSVLVPHLK